METHQSDGRSALGSKDLVFFEILRDSKCTRCSKVLSKGEFLFLDGEQALCLSCADFDHLEYLPRGDAALTRRAKNYSGLSAVVVRFSRSRARYAPTQWPQPLEDFATNRTSSTRSISTVEVWTWLLGPTKNPVGRKKKAVRIAQYIPAVWGLSSESR